MVPTIFSFAPFPVKIFVPTGKDSEWTVRSHQLTMVAAFANSPLYGGGMKVAPNAKMDDGLLDLCIVGAVSPLRLLRLFPSVYAGRHLGIREVEYFQAERVRVETEEPQDVYADGEFVCRTPVEVSAERAALKVVTPA
jgi:diacylglycerol kinase family enzyme